MPNDLTTSLRHAARLALTATLVLACGSDDDAAPSGEAYASWAASPQDYAEAFPGGMPPEAVTFQDQTLRHTLRLSAGGDSLRVRFSNLFASAPLVLDAVQVAPSEGASAIDATGSVPLTFDGATRVTIAPGAEVWSDFVAFSAAAESSVAISIYVSGATPLATLHSLGQQTAYVAPGNLVSEASLGNTDPETRTTYQWLTGVDVSSASARRVIVAFGDSITDGFASTVDANHRYPNYLSERATGPSAPAAFSVVNAGISGNRVLNDVVGPSGGSRFERDALGQTGVSDVIILLGINDIGFSGFAPDQEVPATAITAGLEAMVEAASARGVRTFLATLLPFQGTNAPYYSDAGEEKRQAVNDWIRTQTVAAGVIDFDALMSDPNAPLAMLPSYDSGDHLHPNDAGYSTMAGAIDLTLLQ
jgi:lysophospholipase L1-like esterase